jgi:tetratricopeptide (TPR) repeat protein
MNKGDYTSALREFLKAQELIPEDPYLQNDLGLVYMAKDRLDLAIDHFSRAVEIKPDYAPAKNALGTTYLKKRDWDRAIRIFKELTEDLLYATPHYPHANLGWAYYNKGEYALSLQHYRKSLELKSDFVVAQRGLGRACLAMGKNSEALKVLEDAVQSHPLIPELHFDLGKAYEFSRDYGSALRCYRRVVELAPEGRLAEKAEAEAAKIRRL